MFKKHSLIFQPNLTTSIDHVSFANFTEVSKITMSNLWNQTYTPNNLKSKLVVSQ